MKGTQSDSSKGSIIDLLSEKFIKFTKWILGIFLILFGISIFSQSSFISGILLFIAGLICIPPLIIFIEYKFKFKMPRFLKYITVVGCFVLGIIFSPKNNNTNSFAENKHTESYYDSIANNERNERINQHLLIDKQLHDNIERALKMIENNELNYSPNKLVLFGAWSKIIQQGELSSNKQNNKLAQKLRKKLTKLQVVEFPKIRKDFINKLSVKLWEEDIDIRVYGTGNDIVDITGSVFVSNKNIKKFQQSIEDELILYRFKRVKYRWYDGDNEYQYYDLSVLIDKSLID